MNIRKLIKANEARIGGLFGQKHANLGRKSKIIYFFVDKNVNKIGFAFSPHDFEYSCTLDDVSVQL